MSNLINWFSDLVFNKNKDVVIGLSQLRMAEEPVHEAVKPTKARNKNLKISDLMRGDNY